MPGLKKGLGAESAQSVAEGQAAGGSYFISPSKYCPYWFLAMGWATAAKSEADISYLLSLDAHLVRLSSSEKDTEREVSRR